LAYLLGTILEIRKSTQSHMKKVLILSAFAFFAIAASAQTQGPEKAPKAKSEAPAARAPKASTTTGRYSGISSGEASDKDAQQQQQQEKGAENKGGACTDGKSSAAGCCDKKGSASTGEKAAGCCAGKSAEGGSCAGKAQAAPSQKPKAN
jgi:hypothetical protein